MADTLTNWIEWLKDEQNVENFKQSLVMFLFIVYVFYGVLLALDSRKRFSSAYAPFIVFFCWFFFSILFLPIYLVVRPDKGASEKDIEMKQNKALLLASNLQICNNCGEVIKEDDEFCYSCGFQIEQDCPRCKNKVDINWNYCKHCGLSLVKSNEGKGFIDKSLKLLKDVVSPKIDVKVNSPAGAAKVPLAKANSGSKSPAPFSKVNSKPKQKESAKNSSPVAGKNSKQKTNTPLLPSVKKEVKGGIMTAPKKEMKKVDNQELKPESEKSLVEKDKKSDENKKPALMAESRISKAQEKYLSLKKKNELPNPVLETAETKNDEGKTGDEGKDESVKEKEQENNNQDETKIDAEAKLVKAKNMWNNLDWKINNDLDQAKKEGIEDLKDFPKINEKILELAKAYHSDKNLSQEQKDDLDRQLQMLEQIQGQVSG